MNLSDYYKKENAQLDKMLRRVLGRAGRGEARAEAAPLQLLDLACGPCREAETLVSVTRDCLRGGEAPVRLVGADIRPHAIDEARARAKAAAWQGAEWEFLVEDCARLSRHRALGQGFDVTFLRHQNFWNEPGVWRRIFAEGLGRLKDDGLLIITSYFDEEHGLALKALEEAGAELVATVANEQRLELDAPGKSADRHVAVFRRQSAGAARFKDSAFAERKWAGMV